MNIWEADKLILFILFVIPGFICLKTYELMFPSQIKESSKQLVDAITYSCVNYSLLSYFIYSVEVSKLKDVHPNLYFLFYLFVIFFAPILLAFFGKWLRNTEYIRKNAPHPISNPWEFIFSRQTPYWIKVTYKNGNVVGGRYSVNSFASSAPSTEQLYLEESWLINDKGGFDRAKNQTAGIIILSAEVLHIELIKYEEKLNE